MGVIREFFSKLGLTNIKFKPAYNPYTEPSMEIFSYHEGHGKVMIYYYYFEKVLKSNVIMYSGLKLVTLVFLDQKCLLQ